MQLLEINRKLIHLSSLIYPILYALTNKKITLIVLLIMITILITFEYLRLNNKLQKYNKLINIFLRNKESNSISSGFYFIASCLILVVIANKYLFIISVSILVISDTCAAWVGIWFGKHKLLGGKSLEGTIAFFISGLMVIFAINYWYELPIISGVLILSLLITSIAELHSNILMIDDNILVPISFATVYLGANYIIGG